jgi:coenzyme F420-reducing hydrogenase delta subunit
MSSGCHAGEASAGGDLPRCLPLFAVRSEVRADQLGLQHHGREFAIGVEIANRLDLLGRLTLDDFAHRVLDNVIHDVLGRVIDAACLADLGLLLYAHSFGRGADGLAEITLVDGTEQFHADHIEAVRALGRIEALDDARQDVGIDLDGFRKVRLEDFAVEVFIDAVEEVVEPVEEMDVGRQSMC